jgi:hypothetical protein
MGEFPSGSDQNRRGKEDAELCEDDCSCNGRAAFSIKKEVYPSIPTVGSADSIGEGNEDCFL